MACAALLREQILRSREKIKKLTSEKCRLIMGMYCITSDTSGK